MKKIGYGNWCSLFILFFDSVHLLWHMITHLPSLRPFCWHSEFFCVFIKSFAKWPRNSSGLKWLLPEGIWLAWPQKILKLVFPKSRYVIFSNHAKLKYWFFYYRVRSFQNICSFPLVYIINKGKWTNVYTLVNKPVL